MELCFHIFSLLPVKSLLLLRAVCKWFLSMIDDSEFVSFHLHHFPSNVLGTTFLTVREYVNHNNKLLYGASLISSSNNQGFTDHIYSPDDMQVKGSLNGLVLLVSLSEDRVLLWNPSLRKHRWLSPPSTIFNYFALGYHTACNEHMVLALCWDDAWVYSIKTSSWTVVAFDRRNFGNTFLSYDEYLSVNDGVLLLEMVFLDHVNYVFTWFEFQTRVFRYANYDPVDIKPTHCGLMKLDGGSTVGMWGYDVEDQPSIWALQTDTMSWSKRYKISRELMRHKACTFSLVERNNELLWKYINRENIEVFTSDIETQVIKSHVKYPMPIPCYVTYIESLFMLH